MYTVSFSKALEAVKQGKFIQRQGWNGKNLKVGLRKIEYPITAAEEASEPLNVKYHDYLYMEYPTLVEGECADRYVWGPTQYDLLAEDWAILD